MSHHIPITLLLLCAVVISADRIATTDEGKKVLLLENGTWRYLNDSESSQAAVAQRISLIEIVKNDREFDFRKVRWGMSKKEILASEESTPAKNESSNLEYKVQFLGYECVVSYSFVNDALTRAGFLIRQLHVDPALYYKDYEDLKQYLAPLYGIAVADKCDWKNEIYRDDRSKWGFAVSLGFLACSTQWRNDRTRITLAISGGNHQISTNLEYTALNSTLK